MDDTQLIIPTSPCKFEQPLIVQHLAGIKTVVGERDKELADQTRDTTPEKITFDR